MARGDFYRNNREQADDLVEDLKEIVGSRDRSGISEMFRKGLRDLRKAPAPQQIGIGAAAGWLTGYVTMKVGKMAATAIGGSLLLLQIANYNGYIKVNWNRLTNDSNGMADQLRNRFKIRTKSGMDKVMDFAKENAYFAGGFSGGFFLGIASS